MTWKMTHVNVGIEDTYAYHILVSALYAQGAMKCSEKMYRCNWSQLTDKQINNIADKDLLENCKKIAKKLLGGNI